MAKPGNLWLHDTASALVYSLAGRHAAPAQPEFQPPYNDLTQFVLRQHGRMTDHLRAPMAVATLGFDVLGLLSSGKLFHRLPPNERLRLLNGWKNSTVGFKRDLVRFYESLTLLGLFSRGPVGGAETSPPGESGSLRPLTAAVRARVLTSPPDKLHCEIAVIGSGPGGAITACLLAEAGRDVLLVEEGPFLPLESCAPFSRAEMEQKYRNGGLTLALGQTKIAYVEGRCVGGGSEINSGLYHRTPPEVLEQWRREYQVEGLSEPEMRPHFEACERDVSVSLLPGPAPAASLKLHEGAARLGWKALEVPRWFRYEPASGGGPRGTRQSMTETFVPRFLNAGGQVLPQTRAETIRAEHGRWVIAARHASAQRLRITAGTLFVCAGAVQTPALLRRSGLQRNIGSSLCVHPTVKMVAQFAEPVNAADMGVPVHQVKEFAPRFSFGCSISSPAYLALGLTDFPDALAGLPATWRQMANYYAMITGEGRGTVRPLPGFRDPLVRYRLTARDHRNLGEALRKLGEVLFAAGAVTLYPSLTRGPKLASPGDLAQLPETLPAGRANLMTIHLFSSCPMGEDRRRCAADSFGRVHGVKNLLLSDASLLCTAPGVNPQGSIMAVARRNALKFLNRL